MPNDFVLVHTGDQTTPTFKKLVIDAGQQYLRALNPQYAMIKVEQEFGFLGVIQGYMMRVAKGVSL